MSAMEFLAKLMNRTQKTQTQRASLPNKNDNLEVRKENLFIQQILMKITKKSHSYLEPFNIKEINSTFKSFIRYMRGNIIKWKMARQFSRRHRLEQGLSTSPILFFQILFFQIFQIDIYLNSNYLICLVDRFSYRAFELKERDRNCVVSVSSIRVMHLPSAYLRLPQLSS